MFKKLGSILLGITLLFTITACSDVVETAAAEEGVYVSVDINPSVEFIVDEDDNIVSYNFLNDDAAVLCVDEDFIGMNIEDAIARFLELATAAGYIDIDGNDNAVLITVLGDENDDLVGEIQERVKNRIMRFFAMRYINGQVLTEDFTQADLVAQADELGVTPGKLKLALLAQTVDAELTLDDALEMAVKDLLAIIKVAHQAEMAELTDEELALRQAQKVILMSQFQARLQEHLEANTDLTEEQIEARMAIIRNAVRTESRATWEERLEEWKQRVEERQENTNNSSGN